VSTSRRLLHLILLALLACAAVYLVALGTRWGLHADARALPRSATGPAWERAHVALRRAVDTVHVANIAIAALGAALVALRRRRTDLAAVALATVAGANATTQVLKPLLARTDPLGGEAERSLGASFPSGHATAAMSLALVAVIVVPRAWRPTVALIASGYAACVGVGLVLLVAHYPSDVVGGYLVAGAWAAAMAAIALAGRERGPSATQRPAHLPPPRALAGAIVLALAVGALLLVPASRLGHGVFAVSAVTIAAIALALPVGLALVLPRERRTARAGR